MLIYLILAAFILDLILGDPRSWPHPVIFMGRGIARGEELIRRYFMTPRGHKWGGALLVLGVVGGTYLLVWVCLAVLNRIHPYLGIGAEIWLLYTSLAVKSLHHHARAVALPLEGKNLSLARTKVGLIVGRDTRDLNEAEVTRAVVETVAENTVDGVVAPLFYGFIGGAPLALAYKAVNTLDSMVGYQEAHYRDLGMVAAKFDDLINYLPARITGLLLLLIAPLTKGGFRRTWETIRQDAGKHPSPNGGIVEAGVAGALGVQLGGLNYYFGEPSYGETMGESLEPLQGKHIRQVIVIMYAISIIAVFFGMILRSFC